MSIRQGNKVIAGGTVVTIDDELSTTSVNPIQNRVITNALGDKQATLVSGTNIKTINGNSILGSGDIEIQGGGTDNYDQLTNRPQIEGVTLTGNKSASDLGLATTSDLAGKQNTISAGSGISISSDTVAVSDLDCGTM